MLEITNKTRGPISLVVRSRRATRAFTCKTLPGIGAGQNVYLLEDERTTEYIDRLKNMKLIEVRHVPDA